MESNKLSIVSCRHVANIYFTQHSSAASVPTRSALTEYKIHELLLLYPCFKVPCILLKVLHQDSQTDAHNRRYSDGRQYTEHRLTQLPVCHHKARASHLLQPPDSSRTRLACGRRRSLQHGDTGACSTDIMPAGEPTLCMYYAAACITRAGTAQGMTNLM